MSARPRFEVNKKIRQKNCGGHLICLLLTFSSLCASWSCLQWRVRARDARRWESLEERESGETLCRIQDPTASAGYKNSSYK